MNKTLEGRCDTHRRRRFSYRLIAMPIEANEVIPGGFGYEESRIKNTFSVKRSQYNHGYTQNYMKWVLFVMHPGDSVLTLVISRHY